MGADEESKRRARSERDRSRNDDHRSRERGHRSGHGESSSSEKRRTTQRSGTTTPGAYSASSTDEKSRDSSRKARRNNDRQSDRDRRDRDAKRSARHTSKSRSPTRPGAHRSNHRASDGKGSRSSNGKTSRSATKDGLVKNSPTLDQEQPSSGATTTALDGGEVVAQAILVEDNDGDDKNDDDVQRMAEENREFRERLQQENERQRRKMQEENERRQLEMEEIMKREQEKKRQEEQKRHRRQCVIIVVLLVLIGGGVGAFFGTRGSSSSQTSTIPNEPIENPNNEPSLAPVTDGGGGNVTPMTPNPTVAPSNAPTEPLKYPPPDVQDCEKVAGGLPRDEPNDIDLISSNYQVTLEVESSSSTDTNFQNLVTNFENQIQRILVSELVGCNDIATRRSLLRRHQRKLQQGVDIRYVIFNAHVAVKVAEEKTCQGNASPNCHVVEVNMDMFLQGQEFGFLITSMILGVFDTDQDPDHTSLASKLELESQYPSVSLTNILPLDPTASPSKNPTSFPSASPTTGRPSATPTGMPSVNPTNPPTRRPTTPQPTPDPTPKPTRPRPTLAPSVHDDNDNDCEDIPLYFEDGEYEEYMGGNDAMYTIQCDDLIGTNVIGFSVNKDECGFTCVADKKPKEFEPKCGGAPPGTTVKIQLKGKFIGERIFIGIQADGVEKLPCERPFLVEGEDF